MRFQQVIPRAACYAPMEFGGTTLGQAMIVNINWIQMIADNNQPIFETTHCLNYVENNWFLQIRDFLIQSNGQIAIDNVWTQKPLRQNEKFIVDEIQKIDLPKKKLQIFNHWRLYFQVS